MKFLIDECLSPELVRIARKRGHWESTHVTWLGLRSRKDWAIVRRAIDDGYVLVTNDTTDFRSLLGRQKVHVGLVCINVAPGLMSLDVQRRLFVVALDRLGDSEPINELLEITLAEDRSVRIERFDLPKRAYDIVVTPGAIKRKVIEVRAAAFQCTQCGQSFIPDSYERLAKHFHGFMSWSVYHQITHRLGVKSLGTFFHDVFGIYVNASEFLAFRNLLARYYRRTYKRLLAKLLAGSVLYIDETEIKLRTGSGYIWVCAGADAAIYIFRPSREGDFLRQMLKGFGGVLVSDFYAAYDGLGCKQQRCLIHLMRDMNRAILDNPFDQELQSITAPFGVLLRAIVTTIEEHGLRQRHLKRHRAGVTGFFTILESRMFETDASKALRERLLKNRERLFTFLDHDGVSWNNNLAENAIKRISDLRDDVGRTMKEAGLTEHLVLLSLYQTCRVRSISFLRFLLSRERDMDVFSVGKRRPHRAPRIELFPKGYTPPSLISLRREKQKGRE